MFSKIHLSAVTRRMPLVDLCYYVVCNTQKSVAIKQQAENGYKQSVCRDIKPPLIAKP